MFTMRPAVKTMKPYVPGKPVEDVAREYGITDLAKMNQNENPLGPSPKALEAAKQAMARTHIYPEGTARALRERLSTMWDLPADWFIVGNGSDEVFRLMAETYLEPGAKIVVPAPSYAEYPLMADLMGAETISVPLVDNTMDLSAMAKAARENGARILFLCRPNNPTGAVFSEELMRAFMPQVPENTLVVLDEAYREYDTTPFDTRQLLLDYPNLVVTRTFSKIYGLAGFRLGYGVMRPEVVKPFFTVRDPFSVNALAMAAGLAALDDQEHLDRSLEMTRVGKQYLYDVLERLKLPYVPTESNFILFDIGRSAAEVYEAMLHKGVLLRPCASFGLPTHLRVTIGTEEQNRRFAQALEEVLGK